MATVEVRPEITAVVEHRKASSSCHGALLDLAPGGGFTCQQCGQPCDRVLGEPVRIAAHG